MLSSSRIRDRCASELRAWVGASALHSPHSFDALRNRGERGMRDALAAQNLCRPDQTSRRRDRAGCSRPAQCDCSPVPGAPGNSGCVPICLAMGGRARSGAGGLCSISHRDQWKLPAGAVFRGNVQAGTGSILLLPQGDTHVVRSASRGGISGAPIRTEYNNAIRIKANTRGESDTEMICGRLRLDGAMYGLVTAALPKAIVLSIGRGDLLDRMRMLVQAIDEELQAARPGAATIATELATALFVMMLRLHFEQSAASSGILGLLASP